MKKRNLFVLSLMLILTVTLILPNISYSDEIIYVEEGCYAPTYCAPVAYCVPVPQIKTKIVYKKVSVNGLDEYNRSIARFNSAIEKFNCASAKFKAKNCYNKVSYYPSVERYAPVCDPGYVVAQKVNVVCAPVYAPVCAGICNPCIDSCKTMAVVNTSYLNVRSGPSKNSMVIAKVSRYDKVELISKCSKNGYYKIMIPCTSTIGWVYGDYLSY